MTVRSKSNGCDYEKEIMGKENVVTRFSCVHGLGRHTLVGDLNCGEHVSSKLFVI